MKLIVCLDDQNGMLFNGRRLSMDSAVRRRILEITYNKTLWMNRYSANQFASMDCDPNVDENFLYKAGMNEYCFLENTDVYAHMGAVEELIVYRWNRRYPSDRVFPMEAFCSWKKVSSTDFMGNSHEKLTEEVYLP